MRGYNHQWDAPVFLEIKRKDNMAVSKNRAPVLYRDVRDLLNSGDIENYVLTNNGFMKAEEDARRFLYHMYRYALCPITLICYEREAFFGKLDPSMRITFDKNLRSSPYPSLDDLFKEDAPGHGPVYKNPKKALDAYRAWTSGITEQKALVAFVSMRSSTALMARTLAEELMAEGIDVRLHNLAVADPGELAADMVGSRALALGSPTYHGGLHPLASGFLNMVGSLRPPARCAAFFGSHGWSGGALKNASELFSRAGIEMAGGLEIFGPPQEKDLLACADLARTLAGKIKETG